MTVKIRQFSLGILKTSTALLLLLLLTGFGRHDHHVSLSQINYSEKENSLQITMRYFIDDMEKAILEKDGVQLQLSSKEELPNADDHLKPYLKGKFKLGVNGEPQTINYLGKNYEGEMVFFFLEVKDLDSIREIEVVNQVFFELFDDQQNYVKIQVGQQQKTMILSPANDKEMLKIQP